MSTTDDAVLRRVGIVRDKLTVFEQVRHIIESGTEPLGMLPKIVELYAAFDAAYNGDDL